MEITRKLTSNKDLYFGPFNRKESAEETLQIISKGTMIRECEDKVLKKKRACYLLDIKRCLGPCVNENIDELYQQELKVIKDFLTGNNDSLLKRLLEKMKEYSDREKYEEAEKIKNLVQIILSNISKIKVLKEPINYINAIIFIYANNNISDLVILRNGVLLAFERVVNSEEFYRNISDLYFTKATTEFSNPLNIEKVKIIASFLVNKKAKYEIIYLSEIESREELEKRLYQKLINL